MTTAVFLAPLSVAGGPLFIPGTVSPASGGQLFTYITGSSTKLNTYTTSSGAVANSNPIVLDSGGFVTGSGEVWLIQSSSYRFILAPSTDTDPPASPYWTRDSISGINDVQTQINAAGQEWIAASTTPVFANASSFTISGDQRSTFTVGRRVKTTNSGGTVYGTITSSVFATSTTVFAVPDSGGFDSGLSAVSYGLLSTPDGSVPWTNVTATGNTVTTNSITAVSITTQPLTASTVTLGTGNTIFGLVSKVKTVSTSASSITLVTDPDLKFSIGAGEVWAGQANLIIGNNLNQTGVTLSLRTHSSASMLVTYLLPSIPVAGSVANLTSGSQASPNITTASFGTAILSSYTTGITQVNFYVSSPGISTVSFAFAQANATTTVVGFREGSFLNATRIS